MTLRVNLRKPATDEGESPHLWSLTLDNNFVYQYFGLGAQTEGGFEAFNIAISAFQSNFHAGVHFENQKKWLELKGFHELSQNSKTFDENFRNALGEKIQQRTESLSEVAKWQENFQPQHWYWQVEASEVPINFPRNLWTVSWWDESGVILKEGFYPSGWRENGAAGYIVTNKQWGEFDWIEVASEYLCIFCDGNGDGDCYCAPDSGLPMRIMDQGTVTEYSVITELIEMVLENQSDLSRFCANCTGELNVGSKFCTRCGWSRN